MRVVKNVTELIGQTPMLEMSDLGATIFAKLESFNPCSSVKERVALAMINSAEREGKIDANTTLIEPTSGNTGIGLAMVAASKQLKLLLTMPESMSQERKSLLSLLGAHLVLTPKELGMNGAIAKANELNAQIENSYVFNQFANSVNPQIHYQTTSLEIIEQLGELDVHYFVAGVGTGGTISGIGKRLKEQYPDIQIVAVEPFESAVISGESPSAHKLQGIGAGFIPDNLDVSIIDTVEKVKYCDALTTLKECASTNGLLIGISSAAVLFTAQKIASQELNKGKNIVVLLPDSAERYLSTIEIE
ncbi:MAG: cysteine synthase A [Rikenellaceae bacterium]